MISNKLTFSELEKILKPIIKLDNIETIKEGIFKILHFTNPIQTKKKRYLINANNTGVNSTYKGYEIEIRLFEKKNDCFGIVLHLSKRKTITDDFQNPQKQIINDLKRLCESEITEAKFVSFDPGAKFQKT